MPDSKITQRLITPLRHPLETAAATITAMSAQMRKLMGTRLDAEAVTQALSIVIDAFDLESACIVSVEGSPFQVLASHHRLADGAEPLGAFLSQFSDALLASASPDRPTKGQSRGFGPSEIDFEWPAAGTSRPESIRFTIVPLRNAKHHPAQANLVLVLARRTQSRSVSLEIEEPVARVLSAVFYSIVLENPADSRRLEESGLDSLQKAYTYLPPVLYDYRLRLFRRRLRDVSFAFQPIFDINSTPTIHSWEALARYESETTSPKWLFSTARQWGNDFRVAIDQLALTGAVDQFTSYSRRLGVSAGTSTEVARRLAINVTPGTLASHEYWDTFQASARVFDPRALTLEISEKYEFIDISDDSDEPAEDASQRLQVELGRYRQLGCSVSLDDFGIGHSTIERAMALQPDHIKIDKSLVTFASPHDTLAYAKALAAKDGSSVIAEGVEFAEQLRSILNAKISLVQGYLLGRPVPDPAPMSAKEYRRISRLARDAQA